MKNRPTASDSPLDSLALERLRAVSIADVAGALGLELDSHGRGRCPLCDPSPRSKCLATNGRRFVCFRCNAKGDALELVAATSGVAFREAARLLGELVGVDVNVRADPAARKRARALADERRSKCEARELRRRWLARALRLLGAELDVLKAARRYLGARLERGDEAAADRLATIADRETAILTDYDTLRARDANQADAALLEWLDDEGVAA